MPNWVFNTIEGYTPEMYKQYKAKDGDKSDGIDFNNLIPEPKELNHTIVGTFSDICRSIYAYNHEYRDTIKDDDSSISLLYDRNNPLTHKIQFDADDTIKRIGELAISNPDKPLSELLEDENNHLTKHRYKEYVEVFGNIPYKDCKDYKQVFDNYINMWENRFQETKEKEDSNSVYSYKNYESLDDMGKQLHDLREKYNYDNWYDWRCDHWGTKWNASSEQYNPENQTLEFCTAWSTPYPILAKIAEDHPEAELKGSSDTGEYIVDFSTKNGNLLINSLSSVRLENEDEYDDEVSVNKIDLINPIEISYSNIENNNGNRHINNTLNEILSYSESVQ